MTFDGQDGFVAACQDWAALWKPKRCQKCAGYMKPCPNGRLVCAKCCSTNVSLGWVNWRANKKRVCRLCRSEKTDVEWPRTSNGNRSANCGCRPWGAPRKTTVSIPWAVKRTTMLRKCYRCGAEKAVSKWPHYANGRRAEHCGCHENRNAAKPRDHHLALKRARGAAERARRRAGIAPAQSVGRRAWSPEDYIIDKRVRTAIGKSLLGAKSGRRWESFLGYTLGDLIARLSETLPDGYSMRDFHGGLLHIDHIVPKCTFDVTTPEGLRECWALTNLQSLTAVENLRKGRRVG